MKMIADRIGFIQGRLSPPVNGRIQAFPWGCWQEEFYLAKQNGFRLMEWTLDYDDLYKNPLLTNHGQAEIRELSQECSLSIPSLTGDCFMQMPFWKTSLSAKRIQLQNDFKAIALACAAVGISMLVVPLVDQGRIDFASEEDCLIDFFKSQSDFLTDLKLKIVFESDFSPKELARFIARLDESLFGINYDIGNSAALGFDPIEEINAYGHRLLNVHVKDRILGGKTVGLGSGHADFNAVFAALADRGYQGNYILQTARATNDDHAELLSHYYQMTINWVKCYGA